MRKRLLTMPAAAAVVFAFALISCVTINVYFPAAAIKDLSRQIEDEVAKKAAETAAPRPGEQPAPKPDEKPLQAPSDNPGAAHANPPANMPSIASGSSAQLIPTRTGAPRPAVESTNTVRSTTPASMSLLDALLGATPAYAQSGDVAAPEVSSPAIRKIIDSRASRVAALDQYKAKGVIGENNKALVEIRSLDSLPDLKARAEVQRLVKAENVDREELFKEIAAAKNVELSQLPKIRETYAATLREKAHPGDWTQEPDGKWRQK